LPHPKPIFLTPSAQQAQLNERTKPLIMKNLFCLFAILFACTQINANTIPQMLGVKNTTEATVFIEKGDDFKIEVFTDNPKGASVRADLVGGLIVISEVTNSNEDTPALIKITMPTIIHAENKDNGNLITSNAFMSDELNQMVIINRGKGDMQVHVASQKLMVCNTGSGVIKVSGQSELLESHCVGKGKIKFQEFNTKSSRTHKSKDVAALIKNKSSFVLPLFDANANVKQ